MAKLHKHMIVHATVNNPPLKKDEPTIEKWLTDIVYKMNMEVLRPASAAYCEQVGNRGMTADILITTSHIMLHTWDESDQPFIEFDVYTCSELDPQMVIDSIKIFDPVDVSYKFLDRYNGLTDITPTSSPKKVPLPRADFRTKAASFIRRFVRTGANLA